MLKNSILYKKYINDTKIMVQKVSADSGPRDG